MSEIYKPKEPALNHLPKCNQHQAYCTANKSGRCRILTDTEFHGKLCPFYCDKRLLKEGST